MVEAIPKNIEIQMFKFQSSIIESLENFKRKFAILKASVTRTY